MKIYAVGGAVRDKYLGLDIQDRDWLVVGATVQQMLEQGFSQVGEDFPIFLHPQTHEEYALARTERKSGTGYTGFICDFAPTVTLQEDLIRRDLTINAMAEDEVGKLYDFYGGMEDLNAKILRHVSPAFNEDPLRVLRVARFYARFYELGFKIAPETLKLMQQMANSGELQSLSYERIWLETEKALNLNFKSALVYFETLSQLGALNQIAPEIAKYNFKSSFVSLPNSSKIFQFFTNLQAQNSSYFGYSLPLGLANFSLIFYNLSSQNLEQLLQNLNPPKIYAKLVKYYQRHQFNLKQFPKISAEEVLTIFNAIDAWRNQQILDYIVQLLSIETGSSQQAMLLVNLYKLAVQVDVQAIIQAGFKQAEIRAELNKRRILMINNFLREQKSEN